MRRAGFLTKRMLASLTRDAKLRMLRSAQPRRAVLLPVQTRIRGLLSATRIEQDPREMERLLASSPGASLLWQRAGWARHSCRSPVTLRVKAWQAVDAANPQRAFAMLRRIFALHLRLEASRHLLTVGLAHRQLRPPVASCSTMVRFFGPFQRKATWAPRCRRARLSM